MPKHVLIRVLLQKINFIFHHQVLFFQESNSRCQSGYLHRFVLNLGKIHEPKFHSVVRLACKDNQLCCHGHSKMKFLFHGLQMWKIFEMTDHTHSAKQKKQHQSVCLFWSLSNLYKSLLMCILIFMLSTYKNETSFLCLNCLA